jgi:hypothetical protein
MLNVRHNHFLCRIIHQCWYYLSALKFNDLQDLLASYKWLQIIIKVAAPPCSKTTTLHLEPAATWHQMGPGVKRQQPAQL